MFDKWIKSILNKRERIALERVSGLQPDKALFIREAFKEIRTESTILAIIGDRGSGKTKTAKELITSLVSPFRNFGLKMLLLMIAIVTLGIVTLNADFRYLFKFSNQKYININLWKIIDTDEKVKQNNKASLWRVLLFKIGALKNIKRNFIMSADLGSVNAKIKYITSKFKLYLFIFIQLLVFGSLIAIGIKFDEPIITSVVAVVEVIVSSVAMFSFENKSSENIADKLKEGLSNEIITDIIAKKGRFGLINLHFEDLDRIDDTGVQYEILKNIGILYKSKDSNIFIEVNQDILNNLSTEIKKGTDNGIQKDGQEEMWKLIPWRREIKNRSPEYFSKELNLNSIRKEKIVASLIDFLSRANQLSWRYKDRDEGIIMKYREVLEYESDFQSWGNLYDRIFSHEILEKEPEISSKETTEDRGGIWYIPSSFDNLERGAKMIGVNEVINGSQKVPESPFEFDVTSEYINWLSGRDFSEEVVSRIIRGASSESKATFINPSVPITYLKYKDMVKLWITYYEHTMSPIKDEETGEEELSIDTSYSPQIVELVTKSRDFLEQLTFQKRLVISFVNTNMGSYDDIINENRKGFFDILPIKEVNVESINSIPVAAAIIDSNRTDNTYQSLDKIYKINSIFPVVNSKYFASAIVGRTSETQMKNNSSILTNFKDDNKEMFIKIVNDITTENEQIRKAILDNIEGFEVEETLDIKEWFTSDYKVAAFVSREKYNLPESVFAQIESPSNELLLKYIKFNIESPSISTYISDNIDAFVGNSQYFKNLIVLINSKKELLNNLSEEVKKYIMFDNYDWKVNEEDINELSKWLDIARKYGAKNRERLIKNRIKALKARKTRNKRKATNLAGL